jgi:hypothetical protein
MNRMSICGRVRAEAPGRAGETEVHMEAHEHKEEEHGRFYTFFVDDVEFHVHEESITGGEIMDRAGIPREIGLVLITEDGTQRPVAADEVFELRPGRRFKKAPRFKRG